MALGQSVIHIGNKYRSLIQLISKNEFQENYSFIYSEKSIDAIFIILGEGMT